MRLWLKKIAKSFENIDDLQQADLEKLVSIDEIGEKIAQSILAYFANESNRELVNRLKEAGLQLYRTEEDLSGYTDKLAGTVYCYQWCVYPSLA